MSENKIVQFETIPQIKLGFAGIGLDEVDIINKYIDAVSYTHLTLPTSDLV